MISNQLAALIQTQKRDERHANRMKNDAAYRERLKREAREYDEFCARFGPPIHHTDGC